VPEKTIGSGKRTLEPGTLWAKLTERTERALCTGALRPIPTDCEFVEQDGVRFLVRILSSLARREEAAKKQDATFDPFLPYDEEMFVADVSPTHVALLNKFNVLDHHLLVATRRFEEQESLLTLQDFEALWTCMTQFESLGFYNAGRIGGASQRHKHLQLVPLPLASEGSEVPIAPLLAAATLTGSIGTAPLPFAHAFARLEEPSPQGVIDWYQALRRVLDLQERTPYNLLVTQRWMLLVPRTRECFEGISVNALGFAGALLVRDAEQLQRVRDRGPMEVLRCVAAPARSCGSAVYLSG